jgi:hypothetical protein
MPERRKTMKREVATAALLYCAGMGVAAVVWQAEQALEVLRLFVVPSFAFAAAAFGVDEYAKNIAVRDQK